MDFVNQIKWNWIIDNMQQCKQCHSYKTFDQFKSRTSKCNRCNIKKKTKLHTKPQPIKYDDNIITKIIVSHFEETKPKIKLILKDVKYINSN